MNQTLIDLIEDERKRQDSIPGNTNNQIDSIWIALVIKQLGQVITKEQEILHWLPVEDVNIAFIQELGRERKKHIVNATALMVAWLEDLVKHESLE